MIESQSFEDLSVHGINPDGSIEWAHSTVVDLLRDAETTLAEDGWTRLHSAIGPMSEQAPEHTPERCGCNSWRQALHESRPFEACSRPALSGPGKGNLVSQPAELRSPVRTEHRDPVTEAHARGPVASCSPTPQAHVPTTPRYALGFPPTALPMRRSALFLLLVCCAAHAQTLPPESPTPAVQPTKTPEAGIENRDLRRSVCGWPTPPGVMARDSQRTVYAIQLLDYCNDPKIQDDFLQQQFAKFSRITGRDENCETVKAMFAGECDAIKADAAAKAAAEKAKEGKKP